MCTPDELFQKLLDESQGDPHFGWAIDHVGGFAMLQTMRVLEREGRLEEYALGRWRLTIKAIGETVTVGQEVAQRFLQDLVNILPATRGTFRIREIVDQRGWTYPAAIAAALSLARQGKLEHKPDWRDMFRLLEDPKDDHD